MYRCVSIWWAIILVALVGIGAHEDSEAEFINTMPSCNYTCVNSDVKIPYPFGIGHKCSYNSFYEIVCKYSNFESGVFNPFLRAFDIQIFYISFRYDYHGNEYYNYELYASSSGYNALVVASKSKKLCKVGGNSSSSVEGNNIQNNSLIESPFSFMGLNQMRVEGCQGHVNIKDGRGSLVGGCSTSCGHNKDPGTNIVDISAGCDGFSCCLINLNESKYYQIELSKDPAANNTNNNVCMNVTLMYVYPLPSYDGELPRAIWYWNNVPLKLSKPGNNIFCGFDGCMCEEGYKGNPYLPYGCRALPTLAKKKAMVLGLSISLGTTILLIFCYGMFHVIRRWRQKKRKGRFFKRNGGLLLQQQLTTRDNMVDRTMVFSDDELVKATDSYNTNRILGRGGQGIVYKGMLLDGRVVAIKKSLKVDENQIEHFINEVVILSQINHRNIVKLLGCCLETEVPLLVYEFVPNGTLSKFLHNPNEEFHITWKMRKQIAAESAGALMYLHSASGTPIFHRDIKSTNILLDEKYKAKVADFGISRTIMVGQTHLTTLVQGTLGYMDPEYFQTNQFTEKSDIYSFGVVLIELLTGRKPLISEQSGGWKSLIVEFLLHMETSRLFDIIDPRILDEAKQEELSILASLATRCLNLNGKHRPTMKEVASVLEGIRSSPFPDVIEHMYSKENKGIMEKGSMHSDHHVASSVFYLENDLGCSSSNEVKPLVHTI